VNWIGYGPKTSDGGLEVGRSRLHNQRNEQTVAVVMNGHILIGKGKMRVSHDSAMTLAYAKISSHVFQYMDISS
jgi:hypothetical protein